MSRVRVPIVAATSAAMLLTLLTALSEAQPRPGGGGGQPRPGGGGPVAGAQQRPVARPGPSHGPGGAYRSSSSWRHVGWGRPPSWGWGWGSSAWGGWWGPWYYPFGWGGWWGPSWGWGGWWGPWASPAWGAPAFLPATGSLRLQVSPRETEVFVDGYLAGRVDDFDGTFQRLRLEPGGHEIALYLDGHRTVRERVRVVSGSDVRVRHVMQPLAPGEPGEPRPMPTAPVPATSSSSLVRDVPASGVVAEPAPTGFGAVSIRVQPADAEVFIDGERWDAPAGSERLVVQLAPGSHQIECRREGYTPYSTVVEVRVREATVLNVSLPRN